MNMSEYSEPNNAYYREELRLRIERKQSKLSSELWLSEIVTGAGNIVK